MKNINLGINNMSDKKHINSSKKNINNITIYTIITINLIMTIILGIAFLKEMNYQKDKSIIYAKENLLRDAKFQCLEETGKTDCDYVKDLEEQVKKLNQELTK